jgi:hypothetical protein
MAVYQQKFGKNKAQLIQEWLEMGSEEIQLECKKYGLIFEKGLKGNVQVLMNYLSDIEASAIQG